MTSAWFLLGILILLIAANALFVAVEFSYITVDRSRVQKAAAEGDPTAQQVERGLGKLSEQLSGAQLGITACSLITGYVAEPSVGQLLAAALNATALPASVSMAVSVSGAFIIATFTQMAFGELVPKSWAIAEPNRVARLVAYPQAWYLRLFGWLVRFFDRAAERVVRALGMEPASELDQARSPAELTALVQYSGEEGTLDKATAELVARSIEFGDRTAAEVMVPRPRVNFVERETTVEELIALVIESGHSRFPVQGDDVDDIVGIVHYKATLGVPIQMRAQRRVEEFMVAPYVVAETMTLDPLMRELREPGLQAAIVIDEYGGTAGLVTLEDLVEEIVGEIRDEHDQYVRRYRRTNDGGWMISGLLRPDEASAIIGLEIPEGEDTDTMAGLVVEQLDRIPEPGDQTVLEVKDPQRLDDKERAVPAWIRLTVVSLDGHRVDRMIVHRFDEDPRVSELGHGDSSVESENTANDVEGGAR
ncbi:HlyC/CorC family transporter [Dermatophilus congolensis]|uniref:hemolysin family protein n=1 Tax=Dermatophilus congolensis TaxID=1863 RepID=UPI001AB0134F|nr:hemolysin family protein [Dermatophilus congolensis]MBO3160023.1 HlyC/CorC family transporter [Dermatophilus congolensis]MBO3184567.1 HlyC/CorC family transporter [Dermatophilus congolensis]MBO3207080.1 HlyC/CorC family transporter [Dermatophilus congolensis]